MPLNGKPDAPLINFIEFWIVEDSGKVNQHNAWVTDLVPTADNIVQLVRAARARWKIENEGFNTLKNQGYHLEHNFGHGDQHLSETFFTLNLLAFFMHQIFELVDGLYQRVRTFFSSRRAFWDEVRSAFRLFLFTSWDPGAGAHELAAAAVAALSGSLVPEPVPIRAAATDRCVPDHHATPRFQRPERAIHRQKRLAEPSHTRNPLVCAAWFVLPTCSRHHLAVPASRTSASGRQPPLTENCWREAGRLDAVDLEVVPLVVDQPRPPAVVSWGDDLFFYLQ